MWTTTQDGSVAEQDGRIVCFSLERFISEIAQGEGCFLCGTRGGATVLGEEHVLPRWLLSRYSLLDKSVDLPGGLQVPYESYSVPCCTACQERIATHIEVPMSAMVLAGAPAAAPLMFAWLGLMYLKIHLRERSFRADAPPPDTRRYQALHHAHSVVRALCTGIAIDTEALGSLITLRVQPAQAAGGFDYCDVSPAHAVLVRFDGTAILAVLDDSGAAGGLFWSHLEKISGPVSELQLREVLVDLACLNAQLKTRPTFFTQLDLERKSARLTARRPALELLPPDRKMRGELLLYAVRHLLPAPVGAADLAGAIRSGEYTFLFDGNGAFLAPRAAAPPSDEVGIGELH